VDAGGAAEAEIAAAVPLRAGFKPKDEPDYALYSVYMGRVRKCLESPDVEDSAMEAGAHLLRMVLAFRAYMACLVRSQGLAASIQGSKCTLAAVDSNRTSS
jgi:hypothetical protein